uniref:SPARK domain-containing protein n=1 Tax=Nelumbo nucifera TaxID=4432 RepID=A0A822XVS5_NELNU|nr:TPA_asm: hypothetical protein HUJ06_024559 [Nelumbo nucifera]
MEFFSFSSALTCFVVLTSLLSESTAVTPSDSQQPLKPGDFSTTNTVPAFPVQTQAQICHLDLSDELFGAHARSALQVSAAAPTSSDGPMMPDDSQKCVNSLQSSFQNRNIHIPQPNSTCDAILCFCGIRLHQISSLSCPAAFNVTSYRNATPTAAVKNLEQNCRNSSYAGCTKCLGALEKVNS